MSSNPDSADSLFSQHPVDIVNLQMTEEREGLCLWTASGNSLKKYWIGQRQGSDTSENIIHRLVF
jgi:hypothetical protein